MATNYEYKSIPLDNHNYPQQFRLLVLEAGSGDNDLVGELLHYDVPGWKKSPVLDYEAVSWTWGEELPEAQLPSLLIRGTFKSEPSRKVRLPVKENLAAALRCLRYPNKERVLWIDYVCINQADKIERNDQVKLMLEIYRYASNVLVWLGEPANESERAIAFIRDLNDLDNWRAIVREIPDENQRQEAHRDWRALAALMDRGWFSRRWIVQELSLAREATIYCGNSTLPWRDFETAVSLFERDAERLSIHFQGMEAADYDQEYFKEVGNMTATRLVRLKTDLFNTDRTSEEIAKRYTLTHLVASMWSFEAKDPRDLIYAVLSLAANVRSRLDGPPVETSARDIGDSVSDLATPDERPDPIDRMPTPDDHASTKMTAADARKDSVGPSDILKSASKKFATLPDDVLTTVSTIPKIDDRSADIATGGLPFEGNLNLTSRKRAVGAVTAFKQAAKRSLSTFTIDYKQEFFVICKQFLRVSFTYTENYNLDILLRPWAPMTDEHGKKMILPSWIPSVRNAAFVRIPHKAAPGGFTWKRKAADPLVGAEPGTQYAYYSASKVPKAKNDAKNDEWKFFDAGMDQRLEVFGFVLDKIHRIEHPSIAGSVPAEWLDMGGYDPSDPEKDVDHLWRTLVADRGPNGRNPPEHFRRAFIYCAKAGYETGAINNDSLRRRQHPVVSEFLERMLATVWRRRLFVSKRESFLGLAPTEAKENDHICIVHGMSVPVVLRPIYDDTHQFTHYQMIGACYVHTMMDGHAVDKQEQSIKKLEKDREKNAAEIALLTHHKLLLR